MRKYLIRAGFVAGATIPMLTGGILGNASAMAQQPATHQASVAQQQRAPGYRYCYWKYNRWQDRYRYTCYWVGSNGGPGPGVVGPQPPRGPIYCSGNATCNIRGYGRNNPGYQSNNQQGGFDQGGFDQGGFDQGGFDQGGFDQGGFDQGGFDQGDQQGS
ncbi:hypothetical protein ACFVWP_07475 [Streptomyces sp. NPDC058175]|uniref:hypothetical protein n=1 Tax=Streptomyces sp. NPDC058175 TaxID=3346367 RepID=UPI0036E9905E